MGGVMGQIVRGQTEKLRLTKTRPQAVLLSPDDALSLVQEAALMWAYAHVAGPKKFMGMDVLIDPAHVAPPTCLSTSEAVAAFNEGAFHLA